MLTPKAIHKDCSSTCVIHSVLLVTLPPALSAAPYPLQSAGGWSKDIDMQISIWCHLATSSAFLSSQYVLLSEKGMQHQEHANGNSGLPALYLRLRHSLCCLRNAATNTFTPLYPPTPLAHLIYYHFDHKVSSSDTCGKKGAHSPEPAPKATTSFSKAQLPADRLPCLCHIFSTTIRHAETWDARSIIEEDFKPKSRWLILACLGYIVTGV